MIDARFVPIDRWPGDRRKPSQRKASPFRAGYIDTLDLMEYELYQLRAKDIVFQSGFTRSQLRNDGWPRGGETPNDPAIILSFSSPKGDLSFPCDTYNDFQANMRAIGLSLEALRAVDRYGVTRQAEQYRGWQQLPAPGTTGHFTNAEAAAEFMVLQAGAWSANRETVLKTVNDADFRKEVYRKAAYNLHPDRGGNVDQFKLLQEALDLIGSSRNDAA